MATNIHTTYSRPVDLVTEHGYVETFETCKKAAEYLGVSQSKLSTALRKGTKIKGMTVRDHE